MNAVSQSILLYSMYSIERLEKGVTRVPGGTGRDAVRFLLSMAHNVKLAIRLFLEFSMYFWTLVDRG